MPGISMKSLFYFLHQHFTLDESLSSHVLLVQNVVEQLLEVTVGAVRDLPIKDGEGKHIKRCTLMKDSCKHVITISKYRCFNILLSSKV